MYKVVFHYLSMVVYAISIIYMISAYVLLIPYFEHTTHNKWVSIAGIINLNQVLRIKAIIIYVSNFVVYF